MQEIFHTTLSDYRSYLKLERSLSDNTISSYTSDLEFLFEFLDKKGVTSPEKATSEQLTEYLISINKKDISKRTQARIISSMKSLYRFLESENRLSLNPCDRLDSPKMSQYLPVVLSVDEVISIIESVDQSKPEGCRNRAILETLYSCGLRVSELVNLKISELFFAESFIKVTGKGDKQRLVPIGGPAIKAISFYLEQRRTKPIKKGCEDILFLNRRGGKLTREMIFHIVREQTSIAGVHKDVSPHTFRHSFASHLVENGADLRVVQEMLGHESILTTEIYTHVNTRKWQETILKYHPENKKRL